MRVGHDAEASDDLGFWDLPPDAFGPPDDDEVGVWPQNEAAVRAFLAIDSQFRFTPAGDGSLATGLDYAGARAGFRLAKLKVTPATWSDVQVIEAAAVAALNRKT